MRFLWNWLTRILNRCTWLAPPQPPARTSPQIGRSPEGDPGRCHCLNLSLENGKYEYFLLGLVTNGLDVCWTVIYLTWQDHSLWAWWLSLGQPPSVVAQDPGTSQWNPHDEPPGNKRTSPLPLSHKQIGNHLLETVKTVPVHQLPDVAAGPLILHSCLHLWSYHRVKTKI